MVPDAFRIALAGRPGPGLIDVPKDVQNQPITIDDVLNSPMISDPIHLLEIVMPVAGGAAVVVTSKERAARAKHRPVRITGFGARHDMVVARAPGGGPAGARFVLLGENDNPSLPMTVGHRFANLVIRRARILHVGREAGQHSRA